MAIVDDRGRMFGRFNPVDVFVFVLVVVMIPVAYGAYALFRTPPAKLSGVEPKQFTMGPNLRVRINGTNLRPFMRISFNTVQGRTFMIGSTETADVDLPDSNRSLRRRAVRLRTGGRSPAESSDDAAESGARRRRP